MGYSVYICRKETKQMQQLAKNDDFWEDEQNILPFSDEQRKVLKDRLLQYKYEIISDTSNGTTFADSNSEALLTNSVLYFSAPFGDSVFEILMTASEFTDSGEFAKYDPQTDEWEE